MSVKQTVISLRCLNVSLMVTTKQNLQQIHKQEKGINEYHNGKISSSQRTAAREKERYKGTPISQKTVNEMALISPYLSIITVSVKGLISPIKTHRVARWVKKQNLSICFLQETHFSFKETHTLKVKGWKKIFLAGGNQKRAGVAILISDKVDFNLKTVAKDREGHQTIIKWSIHQKYNNHKYITPNIRASKYIKQILTDLKGKIDNNTIMVKDFNTPLSTMDRSSRRKIKETWNLNPMLEPSNIYRTSYPTAAQYTFFSSVQETFSRIDLTIGHKQVLANLRRLKSYPVSFPTTVV